MKNWNMLLVLAAVLLLPVLTTGVFAQDEAGLSIGLSADKASASVGANVTFTYLISNTGNVTVDNLVLQDSKLGTITLGVTTLASGENVTAAGIYTVVESDLPGPRVTTATISGTGPAGQAVSATSNSVSVALAASSDNTNDGDTQPPVRTKAWILRQLGVPGRGIDNAPGLQKPYNPKSKAAMKLERFMERLMVRENAEIKVKNKNKNKNK